MLAGVAAALVANLLFSAGFVIEKRALSALPPLSAGHPARLVLHLLRSPLWILGAASLLLGFTAQLAVYRTLPSSRPRGCSSRAWSCFCCCPPSSWVSAPAAVSGGGWWRSSRPSS